MSSILPSLVLTGVVPVSLSHTVLKDVQAALCVCGRVCFHMNGPGLLFLTVCLHCSLLVTAQYTHPKEVRLCPLSFPEPFSSPRFTVSFY